MESKSSPNYFSRSMIENSSNIRDKQRCEVRQTEFHFLVVDQSHYCIGTKHYKLHKFEFLAVFSTDFEVVSQNLKIASRCIARARRARGTRGGSGAFPLENF